MKTPADCLLLQPLALQSLFLSLFPSTDANVRPDDEIIRLKMQEAVEDGKVCYSPVKRVRLW